MEVAKNQQLSCDKVELNKAKQKLTTNEIYLDATITLLKFWNTWPDFKHRTKEDQVVWHPTAARKT